VATLTIEGEREAHTIVAKRERGENMREMRSRRVDK
jgi:hypothetical protein